MNEADTDRMAGCWNTIGVRGDRTCPRLAGVGHCHHCDVHRSAAMRMLDRPPAEGSVADAAAHYAQPKAVAERTIGSVLVFRCGAEWLGLPAANVVEITPPRPIHSLPHRRHGALLGIANLRGELVACVELGRLVAGHVAVASEPRGLGSGRLIVAQHHGARVAFPADEVRGIRRFAADELADAPGAAARVGSAYAASVLTWDHHAIGCLDAERLFSAVELALA